MAPIDSTGTREHEAHDGVRRWCRRGGPMRVLVTGATDDFGAGAGNALSNLTKYAAGAFLVLSLTVSVLGSQSGKSKTSKVREELGKATTSAPAAAALGPAVTNAVTPATNVGLACRVGGERDQWLWGCRRQR